MTTTTEKRAGFRPVTVTQEEFDAFGRQRISDPLTLFDCQLQYEDGSLLFHTITTGGGSTTHNPDQSSLTLTAPAGGSVIRQSKAYIRYKPGKSQLVKLTGTFGTKPTSDLVRRVGYYDDDNGIFLQQDQFGVHFIRRSKASGVVVEEKVSQANWNVDTFSLLDLSKAFLMFIDMEWLGVGQARVGFYANGQPSTAHIFNKTPFLDAPYIGTANLPVRYEILSGGVEGGTMKQICSAVISEGGFETELGMPQARDNGGSPSSLTTTISPVIAIRPKLTFKGQPNRGAILPEFVEVFSDTACYYRVYYNANVTTGASWVSQGANSLVEYDVSGTAFTTTNAEIICAGFVAASNSTKAGSADSTLSGQSLTVRLPLTIDYTGSSSTELVVAMATVSGTGPGYASISWKEIY